MTMGDEMDRDAEMDRDRDMERTQPSGEPGGVRAGATYPDDDEPTARQRPAEEEPTGAEPTPEPGAEPMPARSEAMRTEAMRTDGGGRTPGPVTGGESDLLGNGELTAIRNRWESLQARFVDDPAGAARQADSLVGEVLEHLQHRHRALHDEAGRRAGDESDTEALRVEFLRYRSFFQTLLG